MGFYTQRFHGERAQAGGVSSKQTEKEKVMKRENASLVYIHSEGGNVGAHVGVKKFLFSKSAQCCAVSHSYRPPCKQNKDAPKEKCSSLKVPEKINLFFRVFRDETGKQKRKFSSWQLLILRRINDCEHCTKLTCVYKHVNHLTRSLLSNSQELDVNWLSGFRQWGLDLSYLEDVPSRHEY